MANIKVKDLNDTSSITIDNELMVLTDDTNNLVQNITVENLISNIISSDASNAIEAGTDKKLYIENPANVTGELADLTTSDKTNLVGAINEIAAVAVPSLQYSTMNNAKGMLTGDVSADTTIIKDIQYYAHSTFDVDKFTVSGTPTVSDDGIASDLTNSAYITVDKSLFITANSWKIQMPLPLSQTAAAGLLSIVGANCMQIAYTPSTKVFNYSLSSNGSSWDIGNGAFTASHLDITKAALFVIEFTGTQYKLSFWQNGTEIDAITPISNSNKLYASAGDLILGNGRGISGSTDGTIDLKQFSIMAGGVPVFSGNKTGTDTYTIGGNNVTVPYTLSKTGSKIVDSAYRTQVTSVYNELGYAPYYTLSDTDFTLPQGEIYGMMLNKSTPHIVEAYKSGSDWYNLYDNGFLEQGGLIDTVTSTTQTKFFNKDFGNTKYCLYACINGSPNNVQAVFVSKADTDGFYVSYTGSSSVSASWYACGYVYTETPTP